MKLPFNDLESQHAPTRAFDRGPGDGEILPSQTWISTPESVSKTVAEPVFADVSPLSQTVDPKQVERKIDDNDNPVHLCGLSANMAAASRIAKEHSLKVMEDRAQAHGAFIDNRHIGTFDDRGAFSFLPGENLGAFGHSGCVVTKGCSLRWITDSESKDLIRTSQKQARAQPSSNTEHTCKEVQVDAIVIASPAETHFKLQQCHGNITIPRIESPEPLSVQSKAFVHSSDTDETPETDGAMELEVVTLPEQASPTRPL